jgi:hypothetical protein
MSLELLAPETDRLMKVAWTTEMLLESLLPFGRHCLLPDLPKDVRIADVKVYCTGFAYLILRSKEFPRIAQGAAIPELKPKIGMRR